jgi:phospholipid/cholesterol/gamma-HCH transport system substrate-binding protein
MKDQRKTEIRVGLTVVIGLIVFLWILGWAKNFSFVSNEREIKVKFNNVAGLEIGDNVTVNGVRKGYVQNLTVNGNRVDVAILINKDVKLKSDAIFSVSMLDLMGGKKIEIIPGNSDTELDDNKVHQGIFAPDIPSVMSFAGNMQDEVAGTLKDIKITLTSLNKFLQDDNFNREVKSSISNLSKATEQLNNILTENRSNIKELLANGNDLTKNTKELLANNKSGISSSIEGLNLVLLKADTLLSKMNNLADQTVNKQNNLGKMLYSKDFYNNLDSTLKQLNELTGILIKALKDEGIKVDAHISVF